MAIVSAQLKARPILQQYGVFTVEEGLQLSLAGITNFVRLVTFEEQICIDAAALNSVRLHGWSLQGRASLGRRRSRSKNSKMH